MSHKIQIKKLELVQLYKNSRLSILEIGKHFGCSDVTIFNNIRKFKIIADRKRQSNKLDSLIKDKLKELYYTGKLGGCRISELFNCSRNPIYKKMRKF